MSADEILDGLDELAGVEHSICVEYLSIHCALGHDLEPADDGVTAQHVARAAQAASVAAFGEMRHVRALNRALVQAKRAPQLGRASSIRRESSSEVALGPLTLQQLERLLEREREIASAVDERYARLRRAVEAPGPPVFEGELLSEVISALSPDADHSGLPSALTEELDGIPPSEYLRATPHEPRDEFEQGLLDLSDHCYRLVVGSLRIWFEHEEEVFTARSQAIATMNALNMINRLVVERGLLPAFPPPDG